MSHPSGLDPASGNGVYYVSAATFDILETATRGKGCHAARIDLETCRDKDGLLAELARALAFPSTFGGNWDALADCLQDLDWLPTTGGYVLLVGHPAGLRSAAPHDFETFLEILGQAGDFWAGQGRVFRVFLASH